MANKYRGEIEITLDGESFTLRPSFEALVEFEEKAGQTAYEVLQGLQQSQRMSAKTIAAVIWAGIRGHARPGDRTPSFSEIGTRCQKHGLARILPSVIEFLGNALSSDEDLAAAQKAAQGKTEGSLPEAR